MQNRRLAPRRKTLLGAQILSQEIGTTECLLRDLSKSGAKLVVGDASQVPPRFELHVPHLKRRFQAHATWHSQREVGVRLVPAKDETHGDPTDLLARIRRLEAEKRALQQRVLELTGG